jgi:hypothetical protein
MKKILSFLIIFLISSFSMKAQNNSPNNKSDAKARDAVAVIDRLWEAMQTKNADTIRSLFTPEGQLVAVDRPRTGDDASKTRVFTAEAFAKMIVEGKGEYIERMPQPEAKIFGDAAIVFGRYTFHVGNKFSHCGTNTFNLVRTSEGWRIANGVSTLEFQCQNDLKAIAVPVVEARPQDVSTIDGIVKAFYEVISGEVGKARQWERDKTLYAPDIRFVAMSVGKDGKPRADIMNHSKYVNSLNEFFVKEGFVEREIGRVAKRFGNVAHVFSAYEFTTSDKKLSGRGVNSIELFWDGSRWWISAVSWDEERPDNPIPKEFLIKDKSK